jgi:type IV fimbrial biogenesis protein FimT
VLKTPGFSLIELLITLVIVGIIFGFSLPNNTSFNDKNKLDIIQNDIKSAIRFAKTQALISGRSIVLAPMDNWSLGIVAFADNSTHQLKPDTPILHEWSWPSFNITIQWLGYQSKYYLLFSPDPHLNAVNGYFVLTSKRGLSAKLVLNRMGRIRNGSII